MDAFVGADGEDWPPESCLIWLMKEAGWRKGRRVA